MPNLYGFDSPAYKSVQEAVKEHRAELMKKPGVVGVRAGYRVVNQWITTTPVIVVSVDRKKLAADLAEADRIPPMIAGILTDVTQASAREIRAAHNTNVGDTATPGVFGDVQLDENSSPGLDAMADAMNHTLYEKPPNLT